jgi:hypothetical protein
MTSAPAFAAKICAGKILAPARSVFAAVALTALSAAAAMADPGVSIKNANLRQGPGGRYPIVVNIPVGSPVEVGGCRGSWCAVSWQGYNGYALGSSFNPGAAMTPGVPPLGAVALDGGPPLGAIAGEPVPAGSPGAPPPGYPPELGGPPPAYYYPPPCCGPYFPYGYWYGGYWHGRYW